MTAPDDFTADTQTALLVPQVLGAIAEFDKVSTVAKLAEVRKRKREATGKCEGRKGHAELPLPWCSWRVNCVTPVPVGNPSPASWASVQSLLNWRRLSL